MIWQLVKKDPAWGWMPWFSIGFTALFVLARFALPKQQTELLLLQGFFGLALATTLATVSQQADTGFQATLPITVRQVFLSRMLSILALMWTPLVACVAVLAVTDRAESGIPLMAWSAFTCLALVLESAMIRGLTTPRRLVGVPPALWVVAFMTMRFAGPAEWRVWAFAVCWLGVVAFVAATWRALPASFQSARIEPEPRTVRSNDAAATERRESPPRYAWVALWRTIPLVAYLQIFGILVFITIGFPPAGMMIWPVGWSTQMRLATRWLFALPIRQRALFWLTVLPPIVALTGGYLVGVNAGMRSYLYVRGITVDPRQDLPEWLHPVAAASPCRTSNVLPPQEFWIPVASGRAPVNRSPWGEAFQPPVFHVSGFDIYNPFAVGCKNSARFFDWQFRRAAIEVYGRAMTQNERPRFYTVTSARVVAKPRTQIVTVAVMAGWSMMCMLVPIAGEWYRFRRLGANVRIATGIVAYVCVFGPLALALTGKLNVLQWVSWTLPSDLLRAGACLALALTVLYLIVDWVFRHMECVDKRDPSGMQAR